MRTEKEMRDIILGVAVRDSRIRAVCLNGSRANPDAPRDCFQDYDVVYLVTELESFLEDPGWVDVFGERIIMQLPDESVLSSPGRSGRYAYLMQFADGNRVDLTLIPVSQAAAYCDEDSQTVTWLDKDGVLPALPPASDAAYRVRRPSQEEFGCCCNEFWWVCPYVAKGLWRNEILFALQHLNGPARDMLMQMLGWTAGVRTGFSVSVGKCGKYLERYLTREEWERLLRTYPRGDGASVWAALEESGALFRDAAREVADSLCLRYPERDDKRVTAFLWRIRSRSPGETPF